MQTKEDRIMEFNAAINRSIRIGRTAKTEELRRMLAALETTIPAARTPKDTTGWASSLDITSTETSDKVMVAQLGDTTVYKYGNKYMLTPFGQDKLHTIYHDQDGGKFALDRDMINIRVPRRLPTQSSGTCYFHAVMNALLNNYAFTNAFLVHLRKRIDKNEYARKSDDTDASVMERRKLGTQLTLQNKDFKLKDIREIRGAKNENVYNWAHDVIMYHVLQRAIMSKGPEKWSIETDSASFIMMNSFEDQWSLLGKLFANTRNLYNTYGGQPLNALVKILTSSGLQVKHTKRGYNVVDSLIARIPDSGVCLLAYQDEGDRVTSVHNYGQSSGILCTPTHAISYVRNDGEYKIVDSNDMKDKTHTIADVETLYKKNLNMIGYYYTFNMNDWQLGGGDGDGDLDESVDVLDVIHDLAIMTPVDSNVLAMCDDAVCDMLPDELQEALQITAELFTNTNDLPQLDTDGGIPP